MRRNVALLLFDQVDPLTFAGPFEVFTVANELHNLAAFNAVTVAENPGTILAANGLKLVPDHTLESAPAPHVLVLPGGPGIHALIRRPALIEWVRNKARRAEITLSVCTGALLLARTGLLDGLSVTTHRQALDGLHALAPAAHVDPSRRFHDHGSIVTTAGVSAGIDGALCVVGRLLGDAAAERTMRQMEYGRFAQPA